MTPKGLCPLNFSSKVGTLMYFLRPGEALGPDTRHRGVEVGGTGKGQVLLASIQQVSPHAWR